MPNKVKREKGLIENIEAPDGSWWIMACGGRSVATVADDEDLRSIAGRGNISVRNTPYPRRYVGFGAIKSVVSQDEIIGIDEASDGPILSDAAVERLAR